MLINTIVGRVRGDGNSGGNQRVLEKTERKKEAIDTRRPGERGTWVLSDMKKGMTFMGRGINFKVGLKDRPEI